MLWDKKTVEVVETPERIDSCRKESNTGGPYRSTIYVPGEVVVKFENLARAMYNQAETRLHAKAKQKNDARLELVRTTTEKILPHVLGAIDEASAIGLKTRPLALLVPYVAGPYCSDTLCQELVKKGFSIRYATVSWDFDED
jgi:hypothetical protein